MSFDRPRGLPARIIPSAGYQEHCRKDTSIENHLERGEFREASQILEANLQWSLCTHGPEHAMTLDDQEKLALSLRGLGDYAKAANLDRKTLDARSKLQGSENAETLETQHNFALDLFRLKRYEEAAKLDHQTLRVREKMLGPEAPDTLLSRNSLAASLQELGMYKKAYNLNQKTVDIRSKQYKLDHPDLIASRHNLAINLHWLGDLQKSESLLQQNVDILSKGRAPGDRQLAKSIEWLEINRTKQSQAGKRQGDLLRPVNVTASNIPGHKLCSPERKGSKMNIRDGTSADKASLQTVEADKPVLYEQRRENVTQTQILKSSDLSRAPIKTDSQNQGNNAVNLLDMSRSQTTQGSQTQCNNTANNLPPKPSDLLKRPPTSRSQTENNNIVNPPTTKQLQLPKRPTTTGGNTQGNSTDNHPLNKPSELLKKQPKTGSHTESNNIINPPKPSDLPKRPTITGSQMQNDNIINRSKPESLDLLRATTTTDSQMRPKASSDNNLRRKVQTQDISTTRRSSECFQPSTANPREGPERPIVTSRDNVSTTANDQKVYQSEVYSKLCDSKAATEDPYL